MKPYFRAENKNKIKAKNRKRLFIVLRGIIILSRKKFNPWRGKPLVTYQIIVNLKPAQKLKQGLKVACKIDNNKYETGIEILDEQFATINISPSVFHDEWNYSILPE